MTYVEFSVSAGHGTLVEHGVIEIAPHQGIDCLFNGMMREDRYSIAETITQERYSEFISMHGGEKAV